MTALLELAERCERATAEDQRELLVAAAEAVCRATLPPDAPVPSWLERWDDLLEAEAWLDAAMTLVPEGWNWRAGFGGEAYWAAVYPGVVPNWRNDPIAATAALALCAAALRARAA